MRNLWLNLGLSVVGSLIAYWLEGFFPWARKQSAVIRAVLAISVAAILFLLYRLISGPPTQVVIRLGLPLENTEPLAGWMREHNARNPDTIVVLEPVPAQYDNAHAALKDGSFDVIMIDDPWVPEFAPLLVDLDSLPPVRSWLRSREAEGQRLFGDIFVDSLEQAAVYHKKLLGLPLVGNVQLILYRKGSFALDLLPALESAKTLDGLATILKARSRQVSTYPFIARFQTNNDAVEVFWEALRSFGYRERCDSEGALLIPRQVASRAIRWIDSVDSLARKHNSSGRNYTSGREAVTEELGQGRVLMAFGWPSWIGRMRGSEVGVNGG